MQYFLLGLLLSLPALASTLQSSYDCSAIQAGNSQYNLSALGGDYEIDGVVNDGTTKMAYLINICEDLNSAFCSQGVFCPTYGNGALRNSLSPSLLFLNIIIYLSRGYNS